MSKIQNKKGPVLHARMSTATMEKLDYLVKSKNITKAEIVRMGIDMIYNKALKKVN